MNKEPIFPPPLSGAHSRGRLASWAGLHGQRCPPALQIPEIRQGAECLWQMGRLYAESASVPGVRKQSQPLPQTTISFGDAAQQLPLGRTETVLLVMRGSPQSGKGPSITGQNPIYQATSWAMPSSSPTPTVYEETRASGSCKPGILPQKCLRPLLQWLSSSPATKPTVLGPPCDQPTKEEETRGWFAGSAQNAGTGQKQMPRHQSSPPGRPCRGAGKGNLPGGQNARGTADVPPGPKRRNERTDAQWV